MRSTNLISRDISIQIVSFSFPFVFRKRGNNRQVLIQINYLLGNAFLVSNHLDYQARVIRLWVGVEVSTILPAQIKF